MDDEDDEAPLPPETIAASFEVDEDKLEFIGDYNVAMDREVTLPPPGETVDDGAPPPPEMIASALGKHCDEEEEEEEEKRGECDDDDDAPCPPELMAASYEVMEKVNREVKKKAPKSIEDDTNRQVPDEGIASSHEMEENTRSVIRDIGRLGDGNFDEISATMNDIEVPLGPSSLSVRWHNAATNAGDGISSIAPTRLGGDDASRAASGQGHVDILSLSAEVMMSQSRPNFDPNNQSLPLLEATLVQDEPDEPVYDAFPLGDTQHGGGPDWSRKKYRTVNLGLGLVAIAAIITLVVLVTGRPKDPSTPPIMINMNGTTTPEAAMTSVPATVLINTSTSRKPSSRPIITSTTIMTSSETLMNTSALTIAPMMWRQQSSAIFGFGEYEQLAMSANAKTLVIGATGYNSYRGYVEVKYSVDDGGYWSRLGQIINGNATNDFFGESVDITADGTTIICGSPGDITAVDRRVM
ncbi:hypothetical protein ACHAXA_011685 [Cyclostephanos tholiformis]|uniref:Uncharacterized protein n=1 Tax=Cyclostephanos tholiformis TaxID=382380 RepID=A0ABD3SC84_9STRA